MAHNGRLITPFTQDTTVKRDQTVARYIFVFDNTLRTYSYDTNMSAECGAERMDAGNTPR